MFVSLLADGYKVYVEGKLERLPDSLVVFDAAVKLCQCEIVLRKNNDKPGAEPATESAFLNSLKMFPSLSQKSSSASAASSTVTKPEEVSTTTIITTTSTAKTMSTPITSPSTFAIPTVTASTASMSAVNSASSRPRGRPPGSKNALSKSLDWNQPKMDPTTMLAMLGIYSNPSIPAQANFLEDYFKVQASMSSNSSLRALENATAASAMFTSAPKNTTSTATSKFSKSSSQSSTAVATNPSSTVISVGSGQLTITPSSYVSSKVSKNSRPNENLLAYDGANFDIESLIPKSELSASTMFSNMSEANKIKSGTQSSSSMSIPKDLPKSLTITPAPSGYPTGYTGKPIASNPPHVTLHPEPKKQKKSHKRSSSVPFGRVPNFAANSAPFYGDTMYQQYLLNQMMSGNLVANSMHKPSSFLPTSSKPKSSNKKESKSSKSLPFPMGNPKLLPGAQLPTSSSNSSRNFQTTAFRGNQSSSKNQPAHLIDSSTLKFGTTPMTAHSPNKSPVLPPPIARQPSPAMHQAR